MSRRTSAPPRTLSRLSAAASDHSRTTNHHCMRGTLVVQVLESSDPFHHWKGHKRIDFSATSTHRASRRLFTTAPIFPLLFLPLASPTAISIHGSCLPSSKSLSPSPQALSSATSPSWSSARANDNLCSHGYPPRHGDGAHLRRKHHLDLCLQRPRCPTMDQLQSPTTSSSRHQVAKPYRKQRQRYLWLRERS